MYEYNATLRRVVDGDTVDLDVDLGFYMTAAIRFRVLGVNTPELRGGTDETKAEAKKAKAFVEAELSKAVSICIKTEKADSFGRWLADISYVVLSSSGGSACEYSLAEELIERGLGIAIER